MKTCTICNQKKPLEEFSKDRATRDGRRPRCKPCESKRRRELRIERGMTVFVDKSQDNEYQKRCTKCLEVKPRTDDFFSPHKLTKDGLHSHCRECQLKEARHRYRTDEGRAKQMIGALRNHDKRSGRDFDLDLDFVLSKFNEPCYYCGDTIDNIGLDRVDNQIGHLKSNVVPCCYICNAVRSNVFSVSEMKELGKTIKKIKIERRKKQSV